LEAIFWILEGLPTTLAGEWVAGRKKSSGLHRRRRGRGKPEKERSSTW